ncbi:MAG: hypothetical protein KIY12_00635 [Thermoplasmata archaeon]|uniref:Uncharacterized protein n=1 Tax=Candidatus Sysuiplasma superficiale TaxID=2823368 RepID=A0A8J7YJ58_9ARCH|nr:hypothetical protein [Candidatus Sysuiplasma superficiale]MBX8643229.1 hypothetical protein [Candidatus Sysuiplasma superficiale]
MPFNDYIGSRPDVKTEAHSFSLSASALCLTTWGELSGIECVTTSVINRKPYNGNTVCHSARHNADKGDRRPLPCVRAGYTFASPGHMLLRIFGWQRADRGAGV